MSKLKQGRLLMGFLSLFSLSFLTRAPFERNPQDCELICVTGKRKKPATNN
ncbi:hypothetical protein FHW88_000803 [Mucilaginibacter sp. SG538B]|jgi:hypothetical protein|uniref:hypothetical protein n=1 Tax=Mucilaginibacter TaxID=423349 RepID=UPI00159E67FC|nr:hypothetical protein [Mucilaginibacter sp. SG538B]NVM62527.1 hypothetical protein [Mucilaginibacter sp. SG538B]